MNKNEFLILPKKPSGFITSLLLLSVTLLSACGGGGGDSSSSNNTDTIPDAFTFVDQTDVALGSLTESATITVNGIDAAASISVSGGEYSINSGTYISTAGTVTNGQMVTVRHTSSASNSATVDSILTIGGVSDTFSTTTVSAIDTTPDAFTFVDQTDVALSTQIESAAITVNGIGAASAISVSNGEYSIDSGVYTSTAGTVTNGQTVSVRHSSSASNSTTVDTVLTIGGVNDTFSTTTLAVPRTYSIVDTNQTLCYNSSTGVAATCAGAGYDADYSGNQPSYTDNGDGTVTDNITDLVWLQSTDTDGVAGNDVNDKLSQTDATSYCAALDLGLGYTWRLPSIKELYSLILFSGKDASNYMGSDTSTLTPFIDSIFDYAFGDTGAGERIIDGQYASSTSYVSTTMNGDATMFGVNFVDGRIKGYPKNFGPTVKTFYVRCVTGNNSYGTNVFVDNTNSTISDTATGLMWQQDDSASTNWDNAVANCEAATTAGYTDWRLPNTKQLQSIVDYTRSPDTSNYAAIDLNFNVTSFTNEENITDWGYYWASTTHVDNNDDGTNATYLSFGRALGYFGTPTLQVLDVHGAGSQRSNDKLDVANEAGAASATDANGLFYYHGPQGDILRLDNKVRCVRNL